MQKDVVIYKQAAIDAVKAMEDKSGKGEIAGFYNVILERVIDKLNDLPSAQPEIIRCKDCEYGEQDDVGRWFCSDFGFQMGSEDGSGYCANAERRADE